jgi:L-lactate dehydrogenase complex protein LldF
LRPATKAFKAAADRELDDLASRALLSLFLQYGSAMRERGMGTFPDPAAALELGAAIRGEVIARLPELLEEFERNATARGARVLWARNAEEACALVVELARERGIRYVTKGKSMVNDELGLNEALEKSGVEPIETDLGEFIVQQLKRPPFHIVGPAINIPVEEISDLFMEKAGMKAPSTDPVELGYAARLFLRGKFRDVEMGITGVNMAVASTGTIINVENEGNIRFSKSSPRTQVSVMSLEKVVPSMDDALHMLRLLTRSCMGLKITSYVTMDSGPRKEGEIDGPEELFIVIVDNGRSRVYADLKAREALRCIRCGACLPSCPIYGKIGGYPYGWIYSGPIGQVLNPLLLGLGETRDLYQACTLCGSCKASCPAGIDHPALLLEYRARDAEGGRALEGGKRRFGEARLFDLWALAVRRAWSWNLGARFLRSILNRNQREGVISSGAGLLSGWFLCRDLPALPRRSFHELARELEREEARPE